MSFVIAEPCVDVKDGACVKACPVDCIATTESARQYYIDPKRCIDCDLCATVCPVNAIFRQEEVPSKWASYIAANAAFFHNEDGCNL
jgi:NAD-dependent dihydropyrimidine dehydrogenase PreA subunit